MNLVDLQSRKLPAWPRSRTVLRVVNHKLRNPYVSIYLRYLEFPSSWATRKAELEQSAACHLGEGYAVPLENYEAVDEITL